MSGKKFRVVRIVLILAVMGATAAALIKIAVLTGYVTYPPMIFVS